MDRQAGGMWWVWLWRVRWIQWSSMAASLNVLGVSSGRGRFGDSGVSINRSQIVDLSEGGDSEGGKRRALRDPIVLTIVDPIP
eukprot:scaffold58603_cov41-Tisochrysis_lutea.AAC.1